MNQTANLDFSKLVMVLAPLFFIQFILLVIALVMLVRADATRGPKWMWALIIIFINIIGPVLFFVIGRRDRR
ncbi:PLDc N-terminal domain-containing protein [Paenibacillus kobensis]|uniref:PLDc N-terminal domain-containing protein n=1 Tax=Paenibacillus kobensis TaxID=59841 RepID=UPI000FD80D96|nr:PLDc N-terminal domain-containing protein [Paenibacillus kobensis]